MNIIFIGPQGSGKGTQAEIVSEKLGVAHISTGDLLRRVSGRLKNEVDFYMNKGELVPDDLMFRVLKRRLGKKDCENGFILDGFPRDLEQAERLSKTVAIDRIVEISIGDDEAISRIMGRMNCPECGEIYNIYTSPKPKKESLCDKCHVKLVRRRDDNEEALRERLGLYHKKTEPILDKYNSVRVSGERSIENVTRDLIKALK